MLQQNSYQFKAAFPLKKFCDVYSVGDTFARAEIKAGRLKAARLGKKILIAKTDADAWLHSLASAA